MASDFHIDRAATAQQTRDVGPALNQHWVNVLCVLGVSYCSVHQGLHERYSVQQDCGEKYSVQQDCTSRLALKIQCTVYNEASMRDIAYNRTVLLSLAYSVGGLGYCRVSVMG